MSTQKLDERAIFSIARRLPTPESRQEYLQQVCGDNGVEIDLFNRFELLIFLRVEGGYFDARRWIDLVYSSDGSSEHALLFTAATGGGASPTLHADSEYIAACREFLEERARDTKTIEDTRARVLEFLNRRASVR